MLSPFRMAAVAALFLSVDVESARSQELAPPGSAVSIQKLVIDTAFSHTVRYTVKGGSPRLQALVRRVEWTENELSVVEQLQLLKLDTVVNERHAAAFRAAQLTNPYFPPGFSPHSIATGNRWDGSSSLQRSLSRQMAYEATPQAALQLIGFLEQMQTQLDAELKALPPQEKKAAQGPIDELRPRLAALSHADVPPPRPQPVVSGRAVGLSPVDQEQMGTTGPVAVSAWAMAPVEVEWGGSWYAAEVLQVNGGSSLIHYTGWASSWDEWVPAGRIRPAATVRGLQR
jgi:hypothetical protein